MDIKEYKISIIKRLEAIDVATTTIPTIIDGIKFSNHSMTIRDLFRMNQILKQLEALYKTAPEQHIILNKIIFTRADVKHFIEDFSIVQDKSHYIKSIVDLLDAMDNWTERYPNIRLCMIPNFPEISKGLIEELTENAFEFWELYKQLIARLKVICKEQL